MKNAGKACNNRLYRHIRTFEKIIKNYFVIWSEIIIDYIILPAVIVGLGFILYGQFKYNKGIF